MKTIKVLPTAFASASYYLREATQKLASADRLNLGAKWRNSIERLTQQQSPQASPVRSAAAIAVQQQQRSNVSSDKTEVDDEPISLFEAHMTDWAKSHERDDEDGQTTAEGNNVLTKSVTGDESKKASTTAAKSSPPGSPTKMLTKLTRSAINARTKQLIRALRTANNSTSQTLRLQELSRHLMLYPDAVSLAVTEGAVPLVMDIRRRCECNNVKAYSKQALSMLGHSDVPRGQGIRILSIDGGGTRGVIILEILRQIESATGKPIYKLFDVIAGVSTGAILTTLLGANRTTIDQCEEHYRYTSQNLFKPDFWRGTGRLIWTHAYYDSSVWEQILRKVYGERTLMDTTLDDDSPKLMAISACSTSNHPQNRPYVFRNYNLPEKAHGYYEGSSRYKIWQAVRASSSAPGYFEEYILDNVRHQDGGILINNPTSIAIHEAQLLFPDEKIQCVVSIGTGRYTPSVPADTEVVPGPTSLRNKITSFIESATDTEVVHRLLQDLLPKDTYFRINPQIQEWLALDETREEKIDQLKRDGQLYLKRNDYKMAKVAEALTMDRTYVQHLVDTVTTVTTTAKYNYKLFKNKWP